MAHNLKEFFNPQSIAVIGVSHEPQKVGYLVAKSIIDQGYLGKLYLINPHLDTVLDQKVYKGLVEITEPIDLAILAVPAPVALMYLKELHDLHIKNAVIYAAGFRETDDEGKRREKELVEKAEEYGITILGPNCIGFINTTHKVNATFLKSSPPPGTIGIVSQSGALGSAMIDQLVDHKTLGLSYFISLGNKTIMDESDCLEYLGQDDKTEVIGMYLEDVKDGARFRETLAKVTKKKPVVILKAGNTQEGSKAAVSHTGGLVGDAQVYEAVFKQCGAVIANNYQQFFDIIKIFCFGKVPTSSSILVLSNAGGLGVLLTDELVKSHLSLVTINDHTKNEIEKSLDSEGLKRITIHNPIDLLGDASAFDYRQAILSSIQQQEIGAVIVLLTPQANTQIDETAKVIVEAQNHFIKPIFPVFMGEKSLKVAYQLFEDNSIVSFKNYDLVPPVLKNIIDSYEYSSRELPSTHSPESLSILAHETQIKDLFELNNGKEFFNLQDSMNLLHLSGVPILPISHIVHEEEIKYVSNKIKFPVVAKIASDKITHKTEVQGVLTNIDNVDELKKAFLKLSKIAKKEGCFVQKMVSGKEIFLGAKRDKTFGPVVLFGLGGIYVELLKEVVEFTYPFSIKEFTQRLQNTRLEKLCQGFRNTPAIRLQDLYSVGMKIGVLLDKFPEIESIDINPLFITEKGLQAADCRVVLKLAQ